MNEIIAVFNFEFCINYYVILHQLEYATYIHSDPLPYNAATRAVGIYYSHKKVAMNHKDYQNQCTCNIQKSIKDWIIKSLQKLILLHVRDFSDFRGVWFFRWSYYSIIEWLQHDFGPNFPVIYQEAHGRTKWAHNTHHLTRESTKVRLRIHKKV